MVSSTECTEFLAAIVTLFAEGIRHPIFLQSSVIIGCQPLNHEFENYFSIKIKFTSFPVNKLLLILFKTFGKLLPSGLGLAAEFELSPLLSDDVFSGIGIRTESGLSLPENEMCYQKPEKVIRLTYCGQMKKIW